MLANAALPHASFMSCSCLYNCSDNCPAVCYCCCAGAACPKGTYSEGGAACKDCEKGSFCMGELTYILVSIVVGELTSRHTMCHL